MLSARHAFIAPLLLCIIVAQCAEQYDGEHRAADLDNEFAEFEDLDEDGEFTTPAVLDEQTPPAQAVHNTDEDDDDDEDEFVEDDEEFARTEKKDAEEKVDAQAPQPLKFADVPAHFRSNWASYQVEALVLILLSFYMVNYVIGRSRNQCIAHKWFTEITPMLKEQFSLVGDDGVSEDLNECHMVKETDFSYTIWCSGRAGCQGMLITIKLQKRQDLVNFLLNLVRSKQDKVIIRIDIDPNDMDSFVFAIGQRKSLSKLTKELMDLSMFTVERKGLDKLGLPASFAIYAEIFEAVNAIIDPAVIAVIKKYENLIDYFHFSDQYSGYKPSEGETYTRLPETSRVLIFSFNMSNDIGELEALMMTVFHCLEKIRRFRLSREGKLKADKKRQNVQEAFLKTTHQARQVAAQARREEKTRERKQRLLDEEDPERQRRLEKLEQKRDLKLRQPKMKQLKIK